MASGHQSVFGSKLLQFSFSFFHIYCFCSDIAFYHPLYAGVEGPCVGVVSTHDCGAGGQDCSRLVAEFSSLLMTMGF